MARVFLSHSSTDKPFEYQYKGVVLSRTAILKLYQGIPESTVRLELQSEGLSEKFIQNIIKKGPTH